jgi:hypothetical protein
MYRQYASPAVVGLRTYCAQSASKHPRKQQLPCEAIARPAKAPLLCGQSRTTIRARHFAALIGRFWIGGN